MSELRDELKSLKRVAHKQGLGVQKDKRLSQTPYAAMNDLAGKELNMPHRKKAITYDPTCHKALRKRVMDIRHELIERPLMKKGMRYKRAHKIANRKQRSRDAIQET